MFKALNHIPDCINSCYSVNKIVAQFSNGLDYLEGSLSYNHGVSKIFGWFQSISARLYIGENPQFMSGSVIDEPGGKYHPHPVGHPEGPGILHIDGHIDLSPFRFFN